MQGETGAWISWAGASTKEGGDDILHEMIKAKTLSIRRNPKLPPNSSIPWPRNQQVAHTSEVWSDCTTTKDGQNLKEEENEDEQEKDFLNQFEAMKQVPRHKKQQPTEQAQQPPGAASAASAEAPAEKKPQPSERDKAANASCRKMHSHWDRTMREWEAIVAQSKGNSNTVGTKFQTDLEQLLIKGAEIDKQVVAVERAFIINLALADSEVQAGAAACKQLQALIKDGKERADALKPWFNIK